MPAGKKALLGLNQAAGLAGGHDLLRNVPTLLVPSDEGAVAQATEGVKRPKILLLDKRHCNV